MSDLKIQVVVDGSQVPAGMNTVSTTVEAATARIKAAFGSVENAPRGLQTALSALQSNTQLTERGVRALSGALDQMVTDAEKAAAASAETTVQLTGMDRAMALASGRIAGMAAGAGMLGGALGRVAAASSVLGPILAAAFPVIAVFALVDILGLAYDKLIEVTSAMAGWDKEAQHMYDSLIQLNQQTIAFNANLAIEKLRNNEIGLKGTALDLQKEKDLKAEVAIRTDELSASLARENAIRTQLAGTSRTIEVMNPRTRTSTPMTVVDKPDKDEVTRLNKELDEAIKNSQKLSEEIKKLKEVSIPGEGKKEGEDREADAEKAAAFNEKLIASTKRLAEEDLKAFEARKRLEKEAETALNKPDDSDDDFRNMRLREEADEASVKARLEREKEASVTAVEIEQEKVKTLARMGQISAAEEARRLNDLEAQKLQIETAYIQERLSTVLARMAEDDGEAYKKDKAEWDKLLMDKQKAEDTYRKNRQKNVDAAATSEQKVWDKLGQGISRTLDQAVQGIVMGTQRFGTAFAHMIDGMLAKFIQAMLQMAAQWVLTHVFMLAVKKSAQQQEVLHDAKAAAAAAWKAVVGIPIVGPVLAPIAAATAFAGVEAFSAAGGMDYVPADNTLALLHQREMVLPANLADNIRGMTSAGQSSGIAGGSGSTPHQINVTFGDVSAIDARGVQDVLEKQAATLTRIIQKELRRTNQV